MEKWCFSRSVIIFCMVYLGYTCLNVVSHAEPQAEIGAFADVVSAIPETPFKFRYVKEQLRKVPADSAEYHYLLAMYYVHKLDTENKLLHIRLSLQKDVTHTGSNNLMANHLRRLNLPEAALPYYDNAVKGTPGARTYAQRGICKLMTKEPLEAVHDLEMAINLIKEGKSRLTYVRLITNPPDGRYVDYDTLYSALVPLYPRSDFPLIFRGTYRYIGATNTLKGEEMIAAIKDIEKAVLMDRQDWRLYLLLGLTYSLFNGDHRAGTDCLTKAIILNPNNAELYFQRAHAYNFMNKKSEALADVQRARELILPEVATIFDESDLGVASRCHTVFGHIYNLTVELNDLKGALLMKEKGVHLMDDPAKWYCDMGTLYQKMKRHEEAVASFDKSLTFDANNGESHIARAFSLKDVKRTKEAFDGFKYVLDNFPENPDLQWRAGWGFYDLRHKEYAIQGVNTAVQLNPEVAHLYHNRGVILRFFKEHAEAEKNYEKLTQLNPKNNINFYWLGEAQYEQAKYEEAIANFKKSLELNPTGGWELEKIGQCLYALKKYEEAIPWCDRMITKKPTVGLHYAQRAKVHKAMGNTEQASRDISKAKELGFTASL